MSYSHKILLCAASAMLLSVGAMALVAFQVPPAPAPVPWDVADNSNPSQNVIVDNTEGTQAESVTITNDGDDHSIVVRVYKKSGGLVGNPITLESPDSTTVTVPKGGKIKLSDPNDTDKHDGSGTYTIN